MFCITTKLPRDQLFLSIYWSLNLIYHYCLKMRGESPNRFSKVFKILTTLLYILLFPYFIIYVFIYFICFYQF
jgi:steroid 5-alpha reductase family enzyme